MPTKSRFRGPRSRISIVERCEEYFENRYREPLEETDQSLEQLLRNMGLARDGVLTLAGLLLFAKKPERFRPAFMLKAVALPGHELHETRSSTG
ncbi:MAG: hypothetical protein WBQ37_05085 [Candidatus Competibacter sp.]